jgi:DNA/RNA-binding domain of Phe-tRNA-synthetase-like protein
MLAASKGTWDDARLRSREAQRRLPMLLSIADEWRDRVRTGALELAELVVREHDPLLAAELADCGARWRETAQGRPSGALPEVEQARRLYKDLGIDPTKTRPSSESLLRRALKGEALASVNTFVDAVNLCSLKHQLSYGAYDLACIEPPVVLRRGVEDEGYEGIRKGFIHLGGRPALVDGQGAFGNPTSDSARTMVTTETREALVVVYAPRTLGQERLALVLDDTLVTLGRYCRAIERARAFAP